MKINFVSYLNPFQFEGGGEMVNREIIYVGRQRGHTFSFTSARNRVTDFDLSADLDFLVDIFNFPETVKSGGSWIRLNKDLLLSIIKHRPFIHFTNAYADVCNLGYLPCSGLSSNPCSFKTATNFKRNLLSLDFQNNCFSKGEIVRNAFTHSLLNVYVSPLHKSVSNSILNYNDDDKSIIIRPIIDTEKFYNFRGPRDIDYLFVGVISEAKGLHEMRSRFPNKDLVMVGKVHPSISIDFGQHLGTLPYSEIPNLMNRARNFVFLPRWPEPQGRVVVEAALSGCNLIVNENVGAMSFPFDISNPENISGSATKFWEDLESRLS